MLFVDLCCFLSVLLVGACCSLSCVVVRCLLCVVAWLFLLLFVVVVDGMLMCVACCWLL